MVWFGSGRADGIARLRHGRWERLGAVGAFPRGRVSAFLEDRTGAIWIGTIYGLYRWKNGRLQDYSQEAGIATANVRALVEDQEGTLWIATHGRGLLRLRNGRFTTFTTRDGLSNDIVESLYADEHGLWVGTVRGLNLVQGERITVLPLSTTVFMTDIFQILKDDIGNLWLSSNQGLASVSQRTLLDAVAGHGGVSSCRRWYRSTGCAGSNSTAPRTMPAGRAPTADSGFPASRGWWWSIRLISEATRCRRRSTSSSLLVDGRPVELSEHLELPPGGGGLEFHYTATSLLIPERVRFRYMLEGYDHDWVDAGTRRVAYYTQVPGGRYRFRVIAANNDGVWNQAGAEVSLRLRAAFLRGSVVRGALRARPADRRRRAPSAFASAGSSSAPGRWQRWSRSGPAPSRGGRRAAPSRRAAAGGEGGRGSREPGQERVPGQHEPRDPHADERHHRHDRAGARHRRSRPSSASTSSIVQELGRRAADGDQRHSRLLEDRSRQAGSRDRSTSICAIRSTTP